MEPLKLGATVVALWLLASCVSAPAPVPVPVSPPAPESEPVVTPTDTSETAAPTPEPLRFLDSPGPKTPTRWSSGGIWSDPGPLDLEAWSFGWVNDPDSSAALGWPGRFWSDEKRLWKQALDPSIPLPTAARRLETLFGQGVGQEPARAAWLLYRVYSRASVRDQARTWLDRANELRATSTTALERVWDQVFRLQDSVGARALWPPTPVWTTPEQEQKAVLVRIKLFGGTRSLESVGADDYISTQILDRDDLWAATWNGAVVRWSLATDQVDLVLAPKGTVTPVKLLVATGWFLYAFQDQSLMRYSKVTGTWRSFVYPPGWTGLRVQAAVAEDEESLWVANLGQGLWRWSQGQWTLVDDAGGGPFLNALAPDGQGGFLVGTKDRGLWSWKDGVWTPLTTDQGTGPVNVSVLQPDGGGHWLVGTWGEGTWVYSPGQLRRWSEEPDYVTAAAWDDDAPLWAALDQGIVQGRGPERVVLGPRTGLPTGGISGLVAWDGRWIWGTTGQGWGWWSEHENSALLR